MSVSGENGIVNQIEHMGRSYAGASLKGYRVVETDDVVYTKSPLRSNPYGIIKTNTGNVGIVSTLYAVYKGNGNINTKLIHVYFQSDSRLNNYLRPLINKGPKNTLLVSDEGALDGFVYLPSSIKEQNEIVELFDAIELLTKNISDKLSALKKYKEGLINMAIKETLLNWKNKSNNGTQLSQYLVEEKKYAPKNGEYEHLTFSKEGIGPKTDRYNRDFLVNDENKKYKITELNQLCYNPANLKFGVISVNHYGTGIFSPIYVTFRIKNIDIRYLEMIVTSKNFINYSLKYQEGTVYERMAVSVDDFLKIKIVPCSEKDQKNISRVYEMLDKLIDINNEKLVEINKIKFYLLKSMFI